VQIFTVQHILPLYSLSGANDQTCRICFLREERGFHWMFGLGVETGAPCCEIKLEDLQVSDRVPMQSNVRQTHEIS
jgi:hypothetical protein